MEQNANTERAIRLIATVGGDAIPELRGAMNAGYVNDNVHYSKQSYRQRQAGRQAINAWMINQGQ